MKLSRRLMACALLLALGSCGHRGPQAAAAPSLPPLAIDDRGMTMALEDAMLKISYRPWIPRRQILKFAVLPPLGGADTPKNRGIAIEYANNRTPLLLSEWPKQDFSLVFLHGQDITNSPCTIAHYKVDGVAWTTRGALAMTLQPDGNMTPADLLKEARRLISSGGCRG